MVSLIVKYAAGYSAFRIPAVRVRKPLSPEQKTTKTGAEIIAAVICEDIGKETGHGE